MITHVPYEWPRWLTRLFRHKLSTVPASGSIKLPTLDTESCCFITFSEFRIALPQPCQ